MDNGHLRITRESSLQLHLCLCLNFIMLLVLSSDLVRNSVSREVDVYCATRKPGLKLVVPGATQERD